MSLVLFQKCIIVAIPQKLFLSFISNVHNYCHTSKRLRLVDFETLVIVLEIKRAKGVNKGAERFKNQADWDIL